MNMRTFRAQRTLHVTHEKLSDLREQILNKNVRARKYIPRTSAREQNILSSRRRQRIMTEKVCEIVRLQSACHEHV